MSDQFEDAGPLFGEAMSRIVDLGNELAEANQDADLWELASGMLAGAVQFWLFSRQPCEKPNCEDCEDISTAARRDTLLVDEIREFAASSDYYHSPNDSDVGHS